MGMKKLSAFIVSLVSLSCLGASPSWQQFDQTFFDTNSLTMSSRNFMFGTNVMIIDNSIGNDTTAALDPYRRSWRTAYNVSNTNGPVTYGALTVAKSGDWIRFQPSTNAYLLPSLPLNLAGSSGVNLYVPYGVTIIRTNFANTNSTPMLSGLAKNGPIIIPGNNSRIVIDGIVIATNDTAFDAALGAVYSVSSATTAGVTQDAFTNVMVRGTGELRGNTDVIYISHTNPVSITLSGVNIYSDWDCMFFNDNGKFNMAATTRNVNMHATTNFNGASHALVNQCGTYIDYDSVFGAMGAVSGANNNAAIYSSFLASNPGGLLQPGVLSLYGSQLINEGPGTNFSPLVLQNTLLSGNWAELQKSNLWTKFNASDYVGTSISSNSAIYTNIIISSVAVGSPAGAAGPFTFNTSGQLNFTNAAVNGWVSNYVTGDTNFWWVRTATSSGSIKFYSTNGVFGTYFATNQGVAPAPSYAYSNFLSVVVNQVSLGQIIQTNFISGQPYTNNYGRNIEVMANAVLTAAAVSGLSTLELRVSGYVTNAVAQPTAAGTVAGSLTNIISAFIPTNAPYTFTNNSSGIGNSSLVSGGQIIIH